MRFGGEGLRLVVCWLSFCCVELGCGKDCGVLYGACVVVCCLLVAVVV
jgi:hypothetical protein